MVFLCKKICCAIGSWAVCASVSHFKFAVCSWTLQCIPVVQSQCKTSSVTSDTTSARLVVWEIWCKFSITNFLRVGNKPWCFGVFMQDDSFVNQLTTIKGEGGRKEGSEFLESHAWQHFPNEALIGITFHRNLHYHCWCFGPLKLLN